MASSVPTAHLIEQVTRVIELLDRGWGNAAIAAELHVSRPRVSQLRAEIPRLQPWLRAPKPSERLLSIREQLYRLRREALELAVAIQGEILSVAEEADSAYVDALLRDR